MRDKDDKASQQPDPGATVFDDGATVIHESGSGDSTEFYDTAVDAQSIFEQPTSAALSEQLMVGQRIKDRFEIVALLGRGGMGSVYKALDLRKQEARDRQPFVALKSLNEDFARHPQALIALQREARKSQSLAHPNIVTVYDFDRADDRVYMTMEYLRGRPLDRVIASQNESGMPKDQALPLIRNMCAALTYAHSQHIAHADLKPANVFVTDKGAKILDFGIARAVADIGSGGEQTVFDPSELGALTPAYASLEMLNGAEPEPLDDVYALGCIVYELFTGRHPFGKQRADEAAHARLRPARPAALTRREWRALEKALAFKREQRLESVEALQAAFEPRSPWLLWGGAAVLVAIAGVGWLSLQQGQEIAKIDGERLRQTVMRETRIDLARQDLLDALGAPELSQSWIDARAEQASRFYASAPESDSQLSLTWSEIASDWLSSLAEKLDRWKQLDAESPQPVEETLRTDIKLLKAWLQSPLAAPAVSDDYQSITLGLSHIESEMAALVEQRKAELAARAAAEEAAKRERQQQRQAEAAAAERRRQQQAARAAAAAKQQKIDGLVQSLRSELDCNQNALNARYQDWQSLMTLQSSAAQQSANRLQDRLLACLGQLEKRSTSGARSFLEASLQYWPGFQRLASWRIDACADARAGAGIARSRCRDSWQGGRGPELVALPALDGQRFLLARFETSIAEFNEYCRQQSACQPATGSDRYPITGRSVAEYRAYLAWLSEKSGFVYRLPTLAEWRLAHPEDRGEPDPNRNCVFEGLGIRKGGRPVSVRSGKASHWGTINSLGNAAEPVRRGGEWLAVGGSHSDPLERCLPDMRQAWDGSPNELIGLRPLRELR